MRTITIYDDSDGMYFAKFYTDDRMELDWFIPFDVDIHTVIRDWLEDGSLPE